MNRISGRTHQGVAWFGWTGSLLLAAVLGGIAAPPGRPTATTTTPSTTLIVQVVISPTGILVGKYATSVTHDGLIPLGGPIPRGDFLNFRILNREKRPAAFTAFGKTASVKPGASGHFDALATRRGTFAYRAVITGGRTLGGTLTVV